MARTITKTTTIELRRLVAVHFPDDEDYRARLWNSYGVRSTLDLGEAQARELIAEIRRDLGHPERSRPAPPEHPSGRAHWSRRYHGAGRKGFASKATPAQVREIARLEDRLEWTVDPRRLVGFIARTLRFPENVQRLPSALTKAEATDVITGLRRFAAARTAVQDTLDNTAKPTT